LTDVVSVSAGAYHSCALTAAGGRHDALNDSSSIYCWGFPYNGVIGIAQLHDVCQLRGDCLAPRPIRMPATSFGGQTVIRLSLGAVAEHVCAITAHPDQADRWLFCWGRNGDGQIGIGTFAGNVPSPARVSGLPVAHTVVEVVTGSRHTCALLTVTFDPSSASPRLGSDGSCETVGGGCSVICWGANENGQCGLGFTSNFPITSPNSSRSIISAVIQAAAGDD
jgi:alpha-tubulin suppressor-like RCC1 family protein